MKAICNAFKILIYVINDHFESLDYDFITYEEYQTFLNTDEYFVENALLDLLPRYDYIPEKGNLYEYVIIGVHDGKFNCIGIYDTDDNEQFSIHELNSDSKLEVLYAIEDKLKLNLEILEDYKY